MAGQAFDGLFEPGHRDGGPVDSGSCRPGLGGVEDELESVAPPPVIRGPWVGVGGPVKESEEPPDVGSAEGVEVGVRPVLPAQQQPVVDGAFGQGAGDTPVRDLDEDDQGAAQAGVGGPVAAADLGCGDEPDFVGGRRWDLKFKTGETLSLPDTPGAADKALRQFARIDNSNADGFRWLLYCATG